MRPDLTPVLRRRPRALVLALGLLASALAAGNARAQRPQRQPRTPPPELVVVARVEAVTQTPHCGVLFSSPAARHSVLRVERGRAPAGDLYAFYRCGWTSARARVAPGMVLRLALSRSPVGSYGSTVDDLGTPTAPRYYVQSATPAPAP
ncbi:MAG: hypothetical protein HY909_26810 [Deltaproteobacteria bacterium]|nr:hypothetical protein [Deltaproteobacteria bacterium]